MLLKIYQVYYDESQVPVLESAAGWVPVFNPDCTKFFENAVIADAVRFGAHKEAEYFGVVSWNVREKVADSRGPKINSKRFNDVVLLTKVKEESHRWDAAQVIGLNQYTPHDPITHWTRMHPDLPRLFSAVMGAIGKKYEPGPLDHVFYSNHFIAESEIYELYVKEWLTPAMNFMSYCNELDVDSGYPKKLPPALAGKWGFSYYPYQPFICERLFSYFVKENGLTVRYY